MLSSIISSSPLRKRYEPTETGGTVGKSSHPLRSTAGEFFNSLNLSATPKREGLLETLQHLLELSATSVAETLHQTAQLVTQALGAEKVDMFLYDPGTESLLAFGTSLTPMGNKEKAIGLDRLPLANGGREVEVYRTGQPYWTGQAHHDPKMLRGMKEDLRIKSEMLVPLDEHIWLCRR